MKINAQASKKTHAKPSRVARVLPKKLKDAHTSYYLVLWDQQKVILSK